MPFRQHSLTTIAAGVEAYLTTPQSYRQVAASDPLPAGETLSTVGSHPAAPVPAASTLCRWVHRFSESTLAWWPLLLSAVQLRQTEALRPPVVPEWLSAKTINQKHRNALTTAWGVLALLRRLLQLLGLALSQWPQSLLWAPRRPPHLDHTGWFVRRTPVPP